MLEEELFENDEHFTNSPENRLKRNYKRLTKMKSEVRLSAKEIDYAESWGMTVQDQEDEECLDQDVFLVQKRGKGIHTKVVKVPLEQLKSPIPRLVKLKGDKDEDEDDYQDTYTEYTAIMDMGTNTMYNNDDTNVAKQYMAKRKTMMVASAREIEETRTKMLLKQNLRKLTRETLAKGSKFKVLETILQFYQLFLLRTRSFFYIIQPLKLLMYKVERRLGTAIASFFDLWISIIYMNILISIVMLLVIIPWWFSEAAEDLGFLRSWDLPLGLIGYNSKVIGKTFFFYGGYMSTTEEDKWWDSSFSYVLMILLYFGVSLVIIVAFIGNRLSKVTRIDSNLKFSTSLLSLWDHSLTSTVSIESLKRTIGNRFKEYLKGDELLFKKLEKKTKKEIAIFYSRRIFGFVLSMSILVSAPVLVFFITQFQEEINNAVPFATSVIIAVLSVTYPQILKLTILIEGYDDAKFRNGHNIVRTYIVKMSIATALVMRVLFPETLQLTRSEPSDKNRCIGTEAGLVFWQLIWIDFFSSAFSNVFLNIIFVRLKSLLQPQDENKLLEFDLAANVNAVLYRQVIIFIGAALCPMIPFAGVISNVLLFLIKYVMCRWTVRFPNNPEANAKGNVLNLSMLLVTLLLSMIPAVVFLLKSDNTCGPFNNSSGSKIMIEFFEKNETLKKIPKWSSIFGFIQSPLLLYTIIIFLVVMLFFVYKRMLMYIKSYRKAQESYELFSKFRSETERDKNVERESRIEKKIEKKLKKQLRQSMQKKKADSHEMSASSEDGESSDEMTRKSGKDEVQELTKSISENNSQDGVTLHEQLEPQNDLGFQNTK